MQFRDACDVDVDDDDGGEDYDDDPLVQSGDVEHQGVLLLDDLTRSNVQFYGDDGHDCDEENLHDSW